MKVQVLHDRRGNIKSITQVSPDTKFIVSVLAPRGQTAIELELPAELQGIALHSLHETHRVDLENRRLVPAPPKNKRAKPAPKKKLASKRVGK
jgi:hypothetical protein